jgi:nitroreductase
MSSLLIIAHSIEKGLANKEIRYGFGQQKIKEIIELISKYTTISINYSDRFYYILGILDEYYKLHFNKIEFLDKDILLNLKEVLSRYASIIDKTQTQKTTRQTYFLNTNNNFKEFALSRHSIRDFSNESVDYEILKEVFKLAQQAPSACNRQSVHVYAVYDKEIILKLVDLQNHQRGFADNAKPLLVVSYEMKDWGAGEQWFGGYLDSGIYIMNLLYSLHYYKIAAIPLNWYATIENNNKLRAILNLPKSHVPVAFVACGYPIDEFKLVTSKRRNIDEVIHILK